MKFAVGISDSVQVLHAITQAAEQARAQLSGNSCQLVCLFASPIYRTPWTEALARLHEILKPGIVIGCSGSGVIGGDQVFEWVPAVSIMAAHLPGVKLLPFAVTADELDLSSPGGFWIDKIGVLPSDQPSFLLLADPYTCPTPKLLSDLNATFPGRPIIGGLVSGGNAAGENLLFYDTELVREGAVGLALTGPMHLETLIAPGCRPIGRPFVVTKAEDNVVWELGGRQTLEVLREVLMGLSPTDQELAQRAVFAGFVVDEMKSTFQPGDFVIRHLVGIDPPSGAIAVAEPVRIGQTLQFHLRDPSSSQEALQRLLAARTPTWSNPAASGIFLFNCLGRGKSFYGTVQHDMKTIRRILSSQIPVAGMFCNGEIGPIGRTNFLHGYTASLGVFVPVASRVRQPMPSSPGRSSSTSTS